MNKKVNISNKEKWILSYHLITAKKVIDAFNFMAKYPPIIDNVPDLFTAHMHLYYSELIEFLNNTICSDDLHRETIINSDNVVRSIYEKQYIKNIKNYSDEDIFICFDNIVAHMKKYLEHIRIICNEYLPTLLTLDFVAYTKTLCNDEKIDKEYYNEVLQDNIIYKVATDLKSYYTLSDEDKNKCVIFAKTGSTFDENLQKIQDSLIAINVKDNTNYWTKIVNYTTTDYKNNKEIFLIDSNTNNTILYVYPR